MARIYKPTYTVPIPEGAERRIRDGIAEVRLRVRGRWQWCPVTARDPQRALVSASKWAIAYIDASGRRRIRMGYADRSATEKLLADILYEVDRERAGLSPRIHENKSLWQWLEEYLQFKQAESGPTVHLGTVGHHLRRILEECRWTRWEDIQPESVQFWLRQQQHKPRREGGFGSVTAAHYATDLRSFVTWLAGKLQRPSPLAQWRCGIDPQDLRYRRRALSSEDFRRLIEATWAAPVDRSGLSGYQRAVLYQLAAVSGLRASELASLTPQSFQLEREPYWVAIEAQHAKNRRADRIPLPSSVVPLLRQYLAQAPSGQPLWPCRAEHPWVRQGRRGGHAAQMLRGDLARAGIPYRQEGRRYDFHALRAQYATWLEEAGVSLIEAQRLLRHSSPVLTANIYTKKTLDGLAKAAERLTAALPPFPGGDLPESK